MSRTLSNTVPSGDTATLSDWTAIGLTFTTGYASHPTYPVMYQVLELNGKKRVWMRGAIIKSTSGADTDFEDEVLVAGLPTGVQPSRTHTFVVPVYDAGGAGNHRKELHLAVSDTGKLLVWGADAESISSTANSSLTLDHVSWSTA
jgi:hypothetical protein